MTTLFHYTKYSKNKEFLVSKTAWIIFAAVCVILFGGLIALSNGQRLNVDNINTQIAQPASENSGNIADHARGNSESKVILLEYGDFQCPGCQSAHSTLKALSDKYEDQMGFVFRNFPLTSMHPNALIAAAAAEAAAQQGKFWEMHDALYANQNSWGTLSIDERTDALVDYAKTLGLDTDKFRTALGDASISKKIAFDQALGKKDGVTGTPGIFVNGEQATQYVLDGEIVPAGTPGSNPIWSDIEAFEKHILLPAFEKAGIKIPDTADEK